MNPAMMYDHTDYEGERGFGGIPNDKDVRDNQHRMRDVVKEHFRYATTTKHVAGRIPADRVLDQGGTQLSAAYAWRHWLSAWPNPTSLGPDVMTLYERSRKYLPRTLGETTTIRACGMAMRDMGHIERLLWAKDASDMATWFLAGFGSIVMSSSWYENMSNPAPRVAHVRGDIQAWHSYLVLSWVPSRETFVIVNSHGRDWGQDGKKQIPFADMQLLFERGAIACSSTQKLIGTKATVRQHGLVVQL